MSKQSSDDFDDDHTDELPVLLETVAMGDEDDELFASPGSADTNEHTALYPSSGQAGGHTAELRFALAEGTEQIASLEAQIAALTDRSRDLEQRLAERDRLLQEFEQVTTSRQPAEETSEAERRLAAQLAVREGRIAELTAAVARLQESDAAHRAEIERLRTAEAAARREAANLENGSTARPAESAPAPEIQALLEEKAALSDYIAGRRAWWDEAQVKEATLEARVADLEKELAAGSKRLDDAEAFAARESGRAISLRAELVDYARRVATLERELRGADPDAATTTPVSAAAAPPSFNEAASSDGSNDTRTSDAAATTPATSEVPVVSDLVEAPAPAVDVVAQLEAEVGYKRQQVTAQLVELRERDQRLRTATSELEHARRQLAAIRTELEESRSAAARLERTVIDKDRALEARDARITTLQEEIRQRLGAIEKINAIDFSLPRGDSPPTRAGSVEPGGDHVSGPALLCVTGDAPKRFPLAKMTVTVGRGAHCDLQIITHVVSREHARITLSGGSTLIEDLGSRNGVFVNSIRVDRQALQQGDLITIGDTQFRFVESMAH